MVTITCNKCGKEIMDPVLGVNYVSLLDKAICKYCRRDMEDAIEDTLDGTSKYSFGGYMSQLKKQLSKCKL
jgi:hypothetical protein